MNVNAILMLHTSEMTMKTYNKDFSKRFHIKMRQLISHPLCLPDIKRTHTPIFPFNQSLTTPYYWHHTTHTTMDFEWKQRVIFTFVLAVPVLVLGSPSYQEQQTNEITWGRNATKMRMLEQQATLYRQRIMDDDDDESLPPCISSSQVKIKKSFDARKQWIQCPSLWQIRDQGPCNSWAAAVASVLTDRYCIASEGRYQWHVSDQDLLNCASEMGDNMDCSSMNIPEVWGYLVKNGVVTGGYFSSGMGCIPTTTSPCEHSSPSSCNSPPAPFVCERQCSNPTYNPTYEEDQHGISAACQLPRDNIEAIKAEIMTNGPVLAVMKGYSDLYQYDKHLNGGVYENYKERSDPHVPHPVKIVGWDSYVTEGNGREFYWIVANSWGYGWGDGGFFRVRISEDRPKLGAWITSTVSCPTPDLSQSKKTSMFSHVLRFLRFLQPSS